MLIDSFNAMIEEISGRDEALEKHRQTLESTVEQRTLELRHARDAAESANEAKSSFLATMSHEIRTPLNGLMVMAELLAGAGLDQRLQRYAEVIVKSGQSLLTIINDILDLSKIEAGKLELERIPVNPAGIADDVTSLFWEKASSKGLDLAARVAPGMPQMLLADPVRLNQILSNLVNNALKFTEHGQVLISLQYEAGHLTLTVTDSGIGIPQKKLTSCSRPSRRPTRPSPASSAAPVWASRSASAWRRPWAARSGSERTRQGLDLLGPRAARRGDSPPLRPHLSAAPRGHRHRRPRLAVGPRHGARRRRASGEISWTTMPPGRCGLRFRDAPAHARLGKGPPDHLPRLDGRFRRRDRHCGGPRRRPDDPAVAPAGHRRHDRAHSREPPARQERARPPASGAHARRPASPAATSL